MPTQPGERIFTSWKEIASFFGKGVRTVQRWERKFGLPISRPTSAKNVVLATENELRDWIHRSKAQLAADSDGNHDDASSAKAELNDIVQRLRRLEEESARLARAINGFCDRIDSIPAPKIVDGNGNGGGRSHLGDPVSVKSTTATRK